MHSSDKPEPVGQRATGCLLNVADHALRNRFPFGDTLTLGGKERGATLTRHGPVLHPIDHGTVLKASFKEGKG